MKSFSNHFQSTLYILFSILLFTQLTGCKEKDTNLSIESIPEEYTLKQAKEDGMVVFEDLDITSGQDTWDAFLSDCTKGKSASVFLADYFTLGDASSYSEEYYESVKDDYPVLYVKELSYDGSKYQLKWYEGEKSYEYEYTYLMRYEGKPTSTSATFSDYVYYVLVNDSSATWEDIEHGMFSSQMGDGIPHNTVYSDLTFK